MKEKLLIIVGPTAVGKTALSIALAKKFQGEIINGDAVQVYQQLDIGSAKITPEEQAGIPHHLIDIRQPNQSYSVFDFKKDVSQLVTEINNRQKLPIIVGGTGLYIQSLLFDYHFSETASDKEIQQRLRQKSGEELHQELMLVDEAAAEKIHPNNVKRLVRALEVCLTTGKKFSEIGSTAVQNEHYHAAVIGLTMERQMLYNRINQRVLQMIEAGLEEEVRQLFAAGLEDAQAMQAIGYKEFIPYFKAEKNLDEVIAAIQQNSRRFAKRQYTWFRNKMDVNWFEISHPNQIETDFAPIIDFAKLFLGKTQEMTK